MWYTRVAKTGEVLGAAHSAQQDADWLARYGAALGIVEPLQMFESVADPRPVNAKTEPAPAPAKPSLLDILIADKSLASETKAALSALKTG